jgi:hypothetical protein
MDQPIESIKPLYRAAKAAGLRRKAHVGEWGTADDAFMSLCRPAFSVPKGWR